MERTPEQLERFLKQKMSARACENLMGRFTFYLARCQGEEIMAMWSKLPDSRIELPWGVYDGQDSIRRYFFNERPRHEDLDARRGRLDMQALNCRQMVVAEDYQTARGAWMTIGISTHIVNGKSVCEWDWKKLGVDFIYENGEWKIWHMAVYSLLKTDMHVCWTDQEPLTYEDLVDKGHTPDRRPTVRQFWSYGPNRYAPRGQPVPPQPYGNFDLDIGYGY